MPGSWVGHGGDQGIMTLLGIVAEHDLRNGAFESAAELLGRQADAAMELLGEDHAVAIGAAVAHARAVHESGDRERALVLQRTLVARSERISEPTIRLRPPR